MPSSLASLWVPSSCCFWSWPWTRMIRQRRFQVVWGSRGYVWPTHEAGIVNGVRDLHQRMAIFRSESHIPQGIGEYWPSVASIRYNKKRQWLLRWASSDRWVCRAVPKMLVIRRISTRVWWVAHHFWSGLRGMNDNKSARSVVKLF